MLKKKYRLREREVKKVFSKTKPFFSYGIVLNTKKNKKTYNRFAIVISSKSVVTNVGRNYFRRLFYDFIKNSSLYCENYKKQDFYDYVFIVKKHNKLDKKYKKSILEFKKNLSFLENKVNNGNIHII